MRLDKQRQEQLDQANARSARSLELSEEAAKRAQEGLELTQSREKRYAAEQEKRNKEKQKADALLEKSKAEWREAHPDATQEMLIGLDMMTTPGQVWQLSLIHISEPTRPTT